MNLGYYLWSSPGHEIRAIAIDKNRRIETPLIDVDVAFRQHGGGHATGPNWPTFLIFASRHLKGPPFSTTQPAAQVK